MEGHSHLFKKRLNESGGITKNCILPFLFIFNSTLRAHILQNLVGNPTVVPGANSFKKEQTSSAISLLRGPLLLLIALGIYSKVKLALLMLN